MSINFTALFNSNMCSFEQVEEFRINLLYDWNKYTSIQTTLEWVSIYCDDPEKHFNEYGFVGLTGLNDMGLVISPYLCELQNHERWSSFLKERDIQQKIREDCRVFSKYLGNPIYLPDSYGYSGFVFDGKSYQDTLLSLKSRFGEPVRLIEEMYVQREMSWETHGYYIDSIV